MLRTATIACGLFVLCSSALAVEPAPEEYLGALQYRMLFVQQGWGELGMNVAAAAHGQPKQPIQIGGREYAHGLGHHAPGDIIIDLAGEYSEFKATVGVQTQSNGTGSVVFKVFVDDQLKFESGLMKQDSPPRDLSVSVAGAEELRLVVTDGGDGITCDCADWAEARLVRAARAAVPAAGRFLDVAPFADVVTSDPSRTEGARSKRVQEYRAEDVYIEQPVPADARGFRTAPGKPACIGLKWMERRRIREIGFEFAEGSERPAAAEIQAQCWVGESAWQGEYRPVRGEWRQEGAVWMMRIDWSSVPAARGGTRKMRLILPRPVTVRRMIAPAATPVAEASLRVEMEKPLGASPASIAVYNGEWIGTPDPIRLQWDQAAPLSLKLRHARPRPWLSDTTVLLFELPGGAFGVSVDDVVKNGCVYMPDFGLYVTADPPAKSLAEYKQSIAGRQTILQQVRSLPDQTLAQAVAAVHNDIQNNSPTMLSLACDNHKLIAHRDGAVQISSAPETDDLHVSDLLAMGGLMRPTFGSGANPGLARSLDGGWMPIPVVSVRENGIDYRQWTFVAPLGKDAAQSVGVALYTMENLSDKPADASLSLSFAANAPKDDVAEMAPVPSGAVAFRRGRLIAFAQTTQSKPLKVEVGPAGLSLKGTLGPRVTSRVAVFIPTVPMKPEQHTQFTNADDLLRAAREYWTRQLAPAMQVEVPDGLLANTIKASQVHCLIAARNEEKGARVAPWIASVSYGPLESEGHSIIRGMDAFGHHEFARKALDFFIHRYNSAGFLTTGYTLMGTGWHLWNLGEHYGLTRDKAWMQRVAPEVARVCRWVVEQRQKTMQPLADGGKAPEYGLLPPGVMADWNAFAYYFCLNGYFCAGLRSAGEALGDAGTGDAARFVDAARDFQADILRAYAWTRARMPAYRLRNGTSVPGYPSQVHGPGPTGNFFPGEDGNRSWCYDVELGSHHLVPFGILDPASRETAWMMDHMEDVQFLSEGWFDFPADLSAKDPYNRGGFAKVQPYYCRNAEICAMRDDVKPFVRTYFNTIPSLLNLENLSFQEHFHGVGAWNKTHETGYFLHQTRLMMVMERGEDLWLAPLVTSNWLKDGLAVGVTNAPTRFGPVAFRIVSGVGDGRIDATIEPPARSRPRQIVIRLRHPEGKPMQKVMVNNQPHEDFDATREIIRIVPPGGRITVRASY